MHHYMAFPLKQVTTVSVALIGSLALLLSGNYSSAISVIVGIMLLLILFTYGRLPQTSRMERITYAAVAALCILLIVEWPLVLLKSFLPRFLFTINGIPVDLFSLQFLSLLCWLLAFLLLSLKGAAGRPRMDRG